jgi:hypothetical protein
MTCTKEAIIASVAVTILNTYMTTVGQYQAFLRITALAKLDRTLRNLIKQMQNMSSPDSSDKTFQRTGYI